VLLVSSLMTPASHTRHLGTGGLTNFLSKTHHEAFGMISKVPRPTNLGGRNNKSTFLGRQWEGGGSGYQQNDTPLWPRFLFSSSYNTGIPGFTHFKISQDLLTYEPHVLSQTFILEAIGGKKK
jgi:hypothetical protein